MECQETENLLQGKRHCHSARAAAYGKGKDFHHVITQDFKHFVLVNLSWSQVFPFSSSITRLPPCTQHPSSTFIHYFTYSVLFSSLDTTPHKRPGFLVSWLPEVAQMPTQNELLIYNQLVMDVPEAHRTGQIIAPDPRCPP